MEMTSSKFKDIVCKEEINIKERKKKEEEKEIGTGFSF